uniref:PAN-1 domain and Apple-like domain-containing protein n=1 Tax=Strongyloides venezuelensis TaxID=75913 RepID=A0A0K0FAY7_STRVS
MTKNTSVEEKECDFNDPNAGTIFFSIKNMSKISRNSLKFEGFTVDKCKEYCLNVNEFNGSPAFCGSFTFNDMSETCHIVYEINDRKDESDSLEITENTVFFEKSCINGLPKECTHETIKLYPNKILGGYAENLTVAGSIEVCFEECLKNSNYCKSFLYFPKEKECILNSMSMKDKPEAFYNEMNEDVLYGNNECYGKVKIPTSDNIIHKNNYSQTMGTDEILNKKGQIEDIPFKNTTTANSILNSRETTQATYKAEAIQSYDEGKVVDKFNHIDNLQLHMTPPKSNGINIKKNNLQPIPIDNRKSNYFSEWEMWQKCMEVGERLIRKRKCINLKKCKGPLTQMRICKPEDIENYKPSKEVVDEVPGPIGPMRTILPVSVYGSRELIHGVGLPPSIYPNALPVGRRGILPDGAPAHPDVIWSPWSDNCQKFATPQPCEGGLEVGFVTRECLAKNPKECKGPFFRYCTLLC